MSGPTYVRVPENETPDYPMPLGFQPEHQRTSPSAPGGTFIPMNPIYAQGAPAQTAPGFPAYQPYPSYPVPANYAHGQPYGVPNYAPPGRGDYPAHPSQAFSALGVPLHAPSQVPSSPEFIPAAPHLTGEAFEREMAVKTYTFSTSQILKDAWNAYKANWGLLTSFTCLAVGTIFIVFVGLIILIVSNSQQNQGGYYQNASDLGNKSVLLKLGLIPNLYQQAGQESEPPHDAPAMTGSVIALVIFELIIYSTLPALFAGYYTALFHHIRGTEMKFSHFFQGFRVFLPLLGLQIICSLANNIHFLIGIYISMALGFAPMLFLEHNELGFFKSLTLSFRVVHRNLTDNLFLVGLSLMVLVFGSFLFFISLPLVYFMYGFAYLYVFGLNGVTVVQSTA